MELARPLSDEDLAILAIECDTVAGHTCKVLLLDGEIDVAGLRDSMAARLERAPELRFRLTEIDGVPSWSPDNSVDLADHVVEDRRGTLDDEGLRRRVAELFEQRLDRSRPLWRLDVLPRLERGGSALVWRIHHALADGTTAMRIAREALWDEPEAGAAVRPHARPPVKTARHRGEGLLVLAHETPHLHGSPFDGKIDAKRSVAFAAGDLDALKRVAADTCGATVNDAVLTVVGGGIRRWLEANHCRTGPVRVKVPVSLHGADHGNSASEAGNRDSFFILDLPLGPVDPAERLQVIHHATKARKQEHDAEWIDTMMHDLGKASPRLRGFADRLLTSPRSFALNVSNVPGPRSPIEVVGIPVGALYSIAEIRERHALRIAVLSLAGTLRFGLCADPTLLPGVDHMAAAIELEADELVASLAAT